MLLFEEPLVSVGRRIPHGEVDQAAGWFRFVELGPPAASFVSSSSEAPAVSNGCVVYPVDVLPFGRRGESSPSDSQTLLVLMALAADRQGASFYGRERMAIPKTTFGCLASRKADGSSCRAAQQGPVERCQ